MADDGGLFSGLGDLFGSSGITGAANDTKAENKAAIDALFAQLQGLYAPYRGYGTAGGDALQGILGLRGGDEAQKAFNTWLGSTDYNFRLKGGVDALQTGKANANLLNSGSQIKASQQYGTNLASGYLGNYENMLAGQQQVGLNATGQYGNQLTAGTNALMGSNTDALGYLAAAQKQKGNGIGNILGDVAGFLFGG